MSKHIKFIEFEEKIRVVNKNHGTSLGKIYYYPHWRQSVFEPVEGVVFNDECLMDIILRIKGQNANRLKSAGK